MTLSEFAARLHARMTITHPNYMQQMFEEELRLALGPCVEEVKLSLGELWLTPGTQICVDKINSKTVLRLSRSDA